MTLRDTESKEMRMMKEREEPRRHKGTKEHEEERNVK
jgi:ribosomal protein L24E